jgi:hypothetical protein
MSCDMGRVGFTDICEVAQMKRLATAMYMANADPAERLPLIEQSQRRPLK